MTLTKNWTEKDYLNHIIKNKLDHIWHGYCNPKSIDAIRLAAYTPIYSEKFVELLERKCPRQECNGNMVVPLDDRTRKIIYKIVCNGTVKESACGNYKMILYRWVSASDQSKLWFQDVGTVRYYGNLGRTFYSTLSLYDRRILPKNSMYVNESLMMAHTLGMDIDIKQGRGTICDIMNREEIDKVLDIVRGELDTFVGESYNLQTSGNGIYVFIHHNLVKVDIFNQMARFNGWINYLNKAMKEVGITRIKIDPINMPSRVFKLIGSVHQKYDLTCVPIEYDGHIAMMNSDEFKLKNFSIEKYIIDGKLKFYDRYNENNKKSLYDFLEEHTEKHPFGDLRAIRYNFRESVGAITGEEQEEQKDKVESNNFGEYYTGWRHVDVNIPGRVIHKITRDRRHQVEMLGVEETDVDKILDTIWGEREKEEIGLEIEEEEKVNKDEVL
jgi:hypothetical protein